MYAFCLTSLRLKNLSRTETNFHMSEKGLLNSCFGTSENPASAEDNTLRVALE